MADLQDTLDNNNVLNHNEENDTLKEENDLSDRDDILVLEEHTFYETELSINPYPKSRKKGVNSSHTKNQSCFKCQKKYSKFIFYTISILSHKLI